MKRISLLLLGSLILSLFLTACGGKDGTSSDTPDEAPTLSMYDDMSAYILVNDKDFYFDVNVGIAAPGEQSVDIEIMRLICENRGDVLHYGEFFPDREIEAGSKIRVYYLGYYIEDGERIYIDSKCRLYAGEPYTMDVGAGSFADYGFEHALLGVVPSDYITISAKKSGAVAEGNIVCIEYEVGGVNKRGVVDLGGDGDTVEIEGLEQAVVGTQLGATVEGEFRLNGTPVSKITVTNIYSAKRYDADGEALGRLTVTATVPLDYEDPALRGREIYYDAYVSGVQLYETTQFDDSFVLNVLKVKESELSSYEGATLSEKYRARLLSQLTESYEQTVSDYAYAVMAEHYASVMEIIELPEDILRAQYLAVYSEVEYYYEMYNMYQPGEFASLDEYARYSMGLGPADDWQAKIWESVEEAVGMQAAIYYVAQSSGFIPTEDEADRISDEYFEEIFAEYLIEEGITRDKCRDEETYQSAVMAHRESFGAVYETSGYRAVAIENYIADRIISEYSRVNRT